MYSQQLKPCGKVARPLQSTLFIRIHKNQNRTTIPTRRSGPNKPLNPSGRRQVPYSFGIKRRIRKNIITLLRMKNLIE